MCSLQFIIFSKLSLLSRVVNVSYFIESELVNIILYKGISHSNRVFAKVIRGI